MDRPKVLIHNFAVLLTYYPAGPVGLYIYWGQAYINQADIAHVLYDLFN